MTAPTSKSGVSRFLADFRAATRYRVWVQVKGSWEPCSWLPTYPTMTEAELAASKLAMPTDVRAERSGDGSIEGGGVGTPTTNSPAELKSGMTVTPSDPEPQPLPSCARCLNILAFSWEEIFCDTCKRDLAIPVTYGRPVVLPCPIPDEKDRDKDAA